MSKQGTGFTLIELIVVVLVLGIIAAIVAPKVVNVTTSARDNAVLQSLNAVREAIDLYSAHNSGRLPGADGLEGSFKNDLKTYLQKFPVCPVGPPACQNNSVTMAKSGAIAPDAAPSTGWKYYYNRGVLIINNGQPTETDPSLTYDDL